MKYAKSLSQAAAVLQLPYNQVYRHQHRPEFQKTSRGYNIDKIAAYIKEYVKQREDEAKAEALYQSEDELIEKQIKLETARHKCKLLELQIKQKEGNLVDVNTVLDSRAKEINLLRTSLKDMVSKLPQAISHKTETECRNALSVAVNDILSGLSELIQDDWESVSEEEPETPIDDEL